jgi:hypothetical protein
MAAIPSGTESIRLFHELASPADTSSIFLCILLSVLIIEVVFVLVVVGVVLKMNLQFNYISILTTRSY